VLWYIPLLLFLSFSESMLLWLGQDPEVSRLASKFIIYALPGIFFTSLFDATRLFLVAIEEPSAVTVIVLAGVPIGTTLNYLFVITFDLEIVGLALSHDLICLFLFAALTLYCHYTSNPKIRQAWSLPDRESFKGWTTILDIGLPGILLYFIDWSCINSLAIFSGMLGVADLSAMSCILIIAPLLTSIGFGMEMTNTVYVASAIGAKNIKSAKLLADASILMTFGASLVLCIILIAMRNQIGQIFSSDPAVLDLFPTAVVALAVFIVFDSL